MSDKFNNKYRIASSRLTGWDYGWNSSYFITICTQNRACFFGEVEDGKMVLNEIGLIANDCLLQIPEKFPFAKLDNHVVMPNHVHGIVIIDKPDNTTTNVETRFIASPSSDPHEQTRLIASLQGEPIEQIENNKHPRKQGDANVETRFIASPIASPLSDPHAQTRLIASLQGEPLEPIELTGGITGNNNPMLHDNLSKIIRWYKGRTAFESRKINIDFVWQSRFHDHFIRNDESFQQISEYITNNPLNWSLDQFYKQQ